MDDIDIEGCEIQFDCPKKGDELTRTSRDTVRHCEVCKKSVHLCKTKRELEEASNNGLCVAVDIKQIPRRTVGVVVPKMSNKLKSFLDD